MGAMEVWLAPAELAEYYRQLWLQEQQNSKRLMLALEDLSARLDSALDGSLILRVSDRHDRFLEDGYESSKGRVTEQRREIARLYKEIKAMEEH